MRSVVYAIVVSLFGALSSAQATITTFDLTFDGDQVVTDAGTTAPAGTSFDVGEAFELILNAPEGKIFTVLRDYREDFPLTFQVDEANIRIVSIQTSFLRGGRIVEQFFERTAQASVHIGSQHFDIKEGLRFDTVIVEWVLLETTSVGTTTITDDANIFSNFGDPNRQFFNSEFIGLVPVPLPGLPALLGITGLVFLGARYRHARMRRQLA